MYNGLTDSAQSDVFCVLLQTVTIDQFQRFISANEDEAIVTEAEPSSVPQHSLNRCPFCNVEIVPNDKLSNRITDRVSSCVGGSRLGRGTVRIVI